VIGRPVGELLSNLRARVQAEKERTDTARESRAAALAMKLPLVHRTAPLTNPDTWRAILGSGHIRAVDPHTDREKRLGSTRTAYFFFGHPEARGWYERACRENPYLSLAVDALARLNKPQPPFPSAEPSSEAALENEVDEERG
jgi:hypothetical protein